MAAGLAKVTFRGLEVVLDAGGWAGTTKKGVEEDEEGILPAINAAGGMIGLEREGGRGKERRMMRIYTSYTNIN